jgi:hypothetical protein
MNSLRARVLILLTLLIAACLSDEPKVDQEKTMLLWEDQTSIYLPLTAEWTNRVEAADLDGDGRSDLLFANGGNYSTPGHPEPVRIFINQGPDRAFREDSTLIGASGYYARVIKVGDLNNDNLPDIFIGNTYQTQSELFIGTSIGTYERVTATNLPNQLLSVGDAEFGDVNGDGYLDIVLSDWGSGDAMQNEGGQTRLWLNSGNGKFTDVTESQMPEILVEFSWDLEFFDFDNDFDLDILVRCKSCGSSKIYVNDGKGNFTYQRLLPAYTNNYDFEIMDINHDGYLDLITINDGEIAGGKPWKRRQHIFMNDSGRYFLDSTLELWPDDANPGEDDNNNVFLDFDSDGDANFITSSLTGMERLLVNNGEGKFHLIQPIMDGPETAHTLSLIVTDINSDYKPDLIMGQGEGEENIEERIYIGKGVSEDKAAPEISHVSYLENESLEVMARIHDRKTPYNPVDWSGVYLTDSDSSIHIDMNWYGEFLFRAKVDSDMKEDIFICAVDAAGNKSCRKLTD